MIDRNENRNEYNLIHLWIRNNYGKATHCENPECKSINPKRFEWALIKGCIYERDIKHFKRLCPSCHRKYDYTEEMRNRRSEIMKEALSSGMIKNPNNSKGKFKGEHSSAKKLIDTSTNIIYNSVTEACEAFGIKGSTLSMMLTGQNRNKTNLRYL